MKALTAEQSTQSQYIDSTHHKKRVLLPSFRKRSGRNSEHVDHSKSVDNIKSYQTFTNESIKNSISYQDTPEHQKTISHNYLPIRDVFRTVAKAENPIIISSPSKASVNSMVKHTSNRSFDLGSRNSQFDDKYSRSLFSNPRLDMINQKTTFYWGNHYHQKTEGKLKGGSIEEILRDTNGKIQGKAMKFYSVKAKSIELPVSDSNPDKL